MATTTPANGTSASSAGTSASASTAGARASSGSGAMSMSMATGGMSAPGVAGQSTSAGGMSGPAANSGANGRTDSGNYFVSGAWHGYVFTAAQGMGTTVTPMDFSMQTTGMPRCIKGSVAAASDYSGVALLGVNLNDDGSTKGTVTPTKAGVMIEVKNNAGSPLRFQVETPAGGADGRFCAVISGTGGFIPWSSLNTACWDNSGKAYNNEPIASAMVQVPGTNMAAVAYDFCLVSLSEADGGSTPASAGGGMSGSSTTTTPPSTGGGTAPPPIQGGCDGYATRYWDCCKPHCGWKSNVPAGSNPLPACDKSDNSLGGNYDAQNACESGGTAYLCHSMAPWAVNDKLAYGYAAVAASGGDICGRCYQLQFTGKSYNAGDDPGSTALAGKSMIVQAINIGGDVGSGQFDISVPGGGVGMYNACSSQWGVSTSELGQTYGGFLPDCKTKFGRTDHAALKSCVMQDCMNVFEAHNQSELAAGCQWFVDWFEVADNPAVKYKEVACPPELANKGIKRSSGASDACLK
jgi:hypothetical protein